MPNWTENRIVIHGSATKVQEFVEYVRQNNSFVDSITASIKEYEGEDELSPFSFNSILPVPIAIQRTSSPARIVSIEEYNEWFEKGLNNQLDEFEQMACPITEEMQKVLIKDYGCDNWYDWCVRYWGTKWNCSAVQVGGQAQLDDALMDMSQGKSERSVVYTYRFETAWSPPYPIYTFLSDKFVDIEFQWDFVGEGWDFVGSFHTGYAKEFNDWTEADISHYFEDEDEQEEIRDALKNNKEEFDREPPIPKPDINLADVFSEVQRILEDDNKEGTKQ